MKKIYLNTLKPAEIIKRLKDGEVIHYNETTNIIKMIDGIIVEFRDEDAEALYNSTFNVDDADDYYFEEEEEFKIEKTGRYKTRDGRIAYVSLLLEDGNNYQVFGIIEGLNTTSSWTLDGFCYIGEESPEDLVEYIGD